LQHPAGIDLDISASGNGVLVYGVDPSGPAALRLMVGEKVVAIGGTTVAHLSDKAELDRIVQQSTGGDTLVLKLLGREEITPISREMDRHTKIQRRLSLASMVNPNVRDVGVPTIPNDAMPMRRASINNERIAENRRVNNEFMGQDAGMKTGFGTDATQLSTEFKAQRRLSAELSQVVSKEVKGEGAGTSAYGYDATQAQAERSAQRRLSEYRRVNQQVAPGAGRYDMPHDEIVTRRVKKAQDGAAAVRRQRGVAFAGYGERTGYSTEATQLRTEGSAGTHLHEVRRVNEQARGANVGQKTLYDGTAQNVVLARRNSLEIKDLRAVNEQILLGPGTAPPTIPLDNVEHRRASIGQAQVTDVAMVNEQFRGEHVGQKPLLSSDGAEMQSQQRAQRRLSQQMAHNGEQWGEFAGQTTGFTTGAKAFELAKAAPRRKLVNQQIAGVGAGKLSADDVEFRRASTSQAQIEALRRVNEQFRGEHVGQRTGFTSDATQLQTEGRAQVETHNYLRVNHQLRGPTHGEKTNVGYDAKLVQLAANAPKRQLERAGIMLGRATPSDFAATGGVDAECGAAAGPSWRPMSEDVGVHFSDLDGIESDDDEEVELIDPVVIQTILTSIYRSAWKADLSAVPAHYMLPNTALTRVQFKYPLTVEEVTEAVGRLKMFLAKEGAAKSPADYYGEAKQDDFGRVTVRAFLETCDPHGCIARYHTDRAGMRATQLQELAADEERVLAESHALRAKVVALEAEAEEEGKAQARNARAKFTSMGATARTKHSRSNKMAFEN
jgi:hypothetical protein